MMPDLDPFSYYPGQGSAIHGLGGEAPPPHPHYCFHTDYMTVQPGMARFDLSLRHVQATHGELALRVHAIGWGASENATVAAGMQLQMAGAGPRDLTTSLRFCALPDVRYAFYGYFFSNTDTTAKDIRVTLVESGAPTDAAEPPKSVLALTTSRNDPHPGTKLIHVLSHHVQAPISQDCTQAHLAEIAADPNSADALHNWTEVMCANALRANTATVHGLEGVVIGEVSDQFLAQLEEQGPSVRRYPDGSHAPAEPLFADFVLWPAGLPDSADSAQRWALIDAWFARLKLGGIGAVACRYQPSERPLSPPSGVATGQVTQAEIGRWALQLFDRGYSVAPLAFSPIEDLALDDSGLARFVLIARRVGPSPPDQR